MKKKLNCVLLVEDNPLTNLFSEKLITALDVTNHLYIVENGQVGIDYLTRKGKFAHKETIFPDLIFLDINMPVMNGWEFLEEFNRLPENQTNPVSIVVLSTSPNPDDISKAEKFSHVICYNQKPLSKEMFIGIIAKHFPHLA